MLNELNYICKGKAYEGKVFAFRMCLVIITLGTYPQIKLKFKLIKTLPKK